MKVGTVGRFIVVAGAVQHDAMWTGTYRIRDSPGGFSNSSAVLDETHTDGSLPTREEAEHAAFIEGVELARHELARTGGVISSYPWSPIRRLL
jgi:hypothetical protein